MRPYHPGLAGLPPALPSGKAEAESLAHVGGRPFPAPGATVREGLGHWVSFHAGPSHSQKSNGRNTCCARFSEMHARRPAPPAPIGRLPDLAPVASAVDHVSL